MPGSRKESDEHAQRRGKKRQAGFEERMRKLLWRERTRPGIPRGSRFGTYFILSILILIGLLVYSVAVYSNESQQEHIGLARHWHAKLRIIIKGREYPIPASVGVKAVRRAVGGGRGGNFVTDIQSEPLHTHADDGVIHIESRDPRDYTLGEFFKVWGRAFDSNCILDYCNNSTHVVKMLVDGKENPEFDRLVLKDRQDIVISYEGR